MRSNELDFVRGIYTIAKARYYFNRTDKDWFKVKAYAETLIELAKENNNGRQ